MNIRTRVYVGLWLLAGAVVAVIAFIVVSLNIGQRADADRHRISQVITMHSQLWRALVESKPGEPLTEEKVSADLRRIYGRGDFESIDYRIEQGPAGRVMVITPREAPIEAANCGRAMPIDPTSTAQTARHPPTM